MPPVAAAPTPGAPTTHVLYLHGFRSSPQSAKARLLGAQVAQRAPAVHWWCPQLPPSPRQAMQEVMQTVAQWPRETMAVVGSSLGGYYATWVAQSLGCRAVLLNPAVDPARDLERYIGDQTQYHAPQEHFYFLPEYIAELRALDAGPLHDPERFLAVIARGDEVLDPQEMARRYAACRCLLLEGSDHALSDSSPWLEAVLAHLNLHPHPHVHL